MKNVRIDKYDWSQLRSQPNCGVMCITDQDGNPYYPRFFSEELALPDGKYFMLQTEVIQFTVEDGKSVRDLMFFIRDDD